MSEAEQPIVAIVDDDDGVRDSLRFLLEVVGLTVEWSGNANVSKDCSKYGMRDIAATQIVKLVE